MLEMWQYTKQGPKQKGPVPISSAIFPYISTSEFGLINFIVHLRRKQLALCGLQGIQKVRPSCCRLMLAHSTHSFPPSSSPRFSKKGEKMRRKCL